MYPYPKAPITVDISELLNDTFWAEVDSIHADPGIELDLSNVKQYQEKDHHRYVMVPHFTSSIPQNVLDSYSVVMDETLNRLAPYVDSRVFFEDGFLHIVCSYRLVD